MRVALILLAACSAAPSGLSASLDSTIVDEASQLHANAKSASAIHYRWSQLSPKEPKGVFSDPAAASPAWTAPVVCADTDFVLSVRVSNQDNQEESRDLTVTVKDSTELQPPIIATSASDAIAGDELTLRLVMLGPGCGATSIQWADTTTAGTFSDPKNAVTRWRSGVIGASTSANLSVNADGQMHAALVNVRVPDFDDVSASFARADCLGCHVPGGRRTGGFDMTKMSATSKAGRTDCGSGPLFVPGNENASIFIKRLRRNDCGGGTRMPWDNTAYFDDHPGELVQIESWVRAGAIF